MHPSPAAPAPLADALESVRTQSRSRGRKVALALGLGLPISLGSAHGYVTYDRGPSALTLAPAPASVARLRPGLSRVTLAGEGFALGLAHGQALRTDIQDVVRHMNEEVLGTLKRDWLLRTAWKLDAEAPERFRQEMKGVAEGAGVRYADILLINTFDDLKHVSGCSSAVAPGGSDRPLRHARNLDYPVPYLARHKVVFDLDLPGGRLRTIGFPGFIGVLTGMSDRGLGLSSHTSKSHRNAVGEPSGLVYRRMLEEARDLDGAQRILAAARRTLGNNLALSDARRQEARALEFDAKGLAARPAEGDRLFVTNHFQSPGLQRHQDAAWYRPGSGSSARVACLARSLPPGDLTPEAFLAALSERGPGSAWRTPANNGTVLSVLMEPATGHLWVAQGTSPPVTTGGYLELPGRW